MNVSPFDNMYHDLSLEIVSNVNCLTGEAWHSSTDQYRDYVYRATIKISTGEQQSIERACAVRVCEPSSFINLMVRVP